MPVCATCGMLRPYEDFYHHSKTKNNVGSYCKVCHRDYARRRAATALGRASQMWSNIKQRSSNSNQRNPSYANVRLLMTKEEFINWAVPAIETFIYQYPTDTPSIDRIDADGNYSVNNIRIIGLKLNASLSRGKAFKRIKAQYDATPRGSISPLRFVPVGWTGE